MMKAQPMAKLAEEGGLGRKRADEPGDRVRTDG